MIIVTKQISLAENEIEWRFIRSSGPGGQHVNKTETAVQLRFNITTTNALSEAIKTRLINLVGNRMNTEGVLVITGRRFRSQKQNRDDVIARLVHFIRLASHPPKVRKKTRIPKHAKEKRLTDKRKKSELKKMRQSTY